MEISATSFDCSEQLIRENAYKLWEAAGSPECDGVDFWLQSEEQFKLLNLLHNSTNQGSCMRHALDCQTQSEIVVSIADGHVNEIHNVAAQLKQAGMQIDQVLEISGIITGQARIGSEDELRQIAGVIAVEADGEMHAVLVETK